MVSPLLALLATTSSNQQGLISWLREDSIDCYINPAIKIEKSGLGSGYGCFVSDEVAEDELLISIPTSSCLSIADALLDDDCGDKFGEILQKAGPGGGLVGMAGYIAKEYLKMEHLGDDYGGRWSAYLKTMPFREGMNEQDHMLWWSKNEVETLMKGSYAFDDAMGLRDEVDVAVKILSGVIGPSIKRTRQGFLPFGGNTEGVDEAIRGAFVSILSRAFDGLLDEEELRLVPLLDMLQHSDEPNIRHATNNGQVDIRARSAINAGTELLNTYNEQLVPWKYFTRFGFVPGKNAVSARALLQAKDPVFFEARATAEV